MRLNKTLLKIHLQPKPSLCYPHWCSEHNPCSTTPCETTPVVGCWTSTWHDKPRKVQPNCYHAYLSLNLIAGAPTSLFIMFDDDDTDWCMMIDRNVGPARLRAHARYLNNISFIDPCWLTSYWEASGWRRY